MQNTIVEKVEPYQAKINDEIQEILIEIFRTNSRDSQLEISNLVNQIYRINHLIYYQKNNPLRPFFKQTKSSQELILWL